jgi:hypothetical protein
MIMRTLATLHAALLMVALQLLSAHTDVQQAAANGARPGVQAPRGYRFPTESDYTGDWKDFRSQNPIPFHAQGDFNGDGVEDDVWLLPASSGKDGFGVYLFLGSRTGNPKVSRLAFARDDPPQQFGLGAVKPGSYDTACGKGYWVCKKGEPETLNLKIAAIEFSVFESSSSIFWWDVKVQKFQRTWTSD